MVRDPAPHTGAGGAVALALVAGARLPRPAGQARAVLGQRVMAETGPSLGKSCQSRLLMSTKLTVITPKSLSISLFMAPISLSISLREEEEEVEEEERAEG